MHSSQLSGFYLLRQLSTDDSSDDDGGGDSSGAHLTNSTSAHCSSRSTEMVGSSRMDNSRSRTDNNHIGNPDTQIRLPQRQPLSERLIAARAQEVIQLPPMQ